MEQIRSPIAARRIGADGRTLVIHADAHWHRLISDAKIDFFAKLGERMTIEGIPSRVTLAGGQTSRVLLGQDHMHIMVGLGPSYGANVLHAHPSYIWGFWYLDEIGYHWNSSIRLCQFQPEKIDAEKAAYFFNGMTSWMLKTNLSLLQQNPREEQPLAEAAAVVYCQEVENGQDRCHFLSTEDMLRTTAETHPDRIVYVKVHPNQSKPMRQQIIAICQDYPNLQMTNASVHDLNGASDVIVTHNSAAGFEALMQRKPVITCARSDFWHATLTPRNIADLREALRHGAQAMGGFDYEKFLYWFLGRKCLEPQKPEFASRAWARIRDKAYL